MAHNLGFQNDPIITDTTGDVCRRKLDGLGFRVEGLGGRL